MARTSLSTALFSLCILVPGIVFAADTQVSVSAGTGYAVFDDAFGFDGGPVLEGKATLLYRGVGLELTYGKTLGESRFVPDRDSPVDHFGLDLIWNFLPQSRFRPYLTAGWGRLDLDLPGGEKRGLDGRELGGGVRFPLERTAEYDAALRVGVKDLLVKSRNPFADDGDTKHTLFFSAAIEVGLPGPDRDSDGDGVPDRRDRCPDTRWGIRVDEHGCELDSDGDGVQDGRDICPDTLPGTPVDDRGCPES